MKQHRGSRDRLLHHAAGADLRREVAGLDSGFGIVVVGLFLGALESLASFYLGSGWREVPGLVLLILALAVRPTGIFGKVAIRKV